MNLSSINLALSRSSSPAFSPSSLFAAGEQGVWYEPSLTNGTCFQDSSGTTPVTAVEQPVGLMLDKSGRGNHAFQTTSTSRPVLSARYNLLTKTEQFDDAAWTKTNVTVTPNAAVAPDGTMTADRLIETGGATGNKQVNTTVTLGGGTFYTYTLRAKPNGRNSVYVSAGSTSPWGTTGSQIGVYVNLTTGVVFLAEGGATATATVGSDGWASVVVNFPITTTGGGCFPLVRLCLDNGTFSYTGDGSSGIYIWGASLVPANQASIPYQRVNTATDYDADPAKFPPYLKFDGVDDFLVTNSIDFTSTDKMTVFAGLRKLSDAANGRVFTNETEVSGVGVGQTVLFAPNGSQANYGFRSGVTTMNTVNASSDYASPHTAVLSLLADAAADSVIGRVNGASFSGTSEMGAGNFPARSLSIGKGQVSGALQPFNGHIYSLIVRGAATTDARIAQTEKWVAKKTGVTL